MRRKGLMEDARREQGENRLVSVILSNLPIGMVAAFVFVLSPSLALTVAGLWLLVSIVLCLDAVLRSELAGTESNFDQAAAMLYAVLLALCVCPLMLIAGLGLGYSLIGWIAQ